MGARGGVRVVTQAACALVSALGDLTVGMGKRDVYKFEMKPRSTNAINHLMSRSRRDIFSL